MNQNITKPNELTNHTFLSRFIDVIYGLHKSEDDEVIAGVCGGLGESFDMPSWIIRLLFFFSVLLFGIGLFTYIIMAIFLPTVKVKRDIKKAIKLLEKNGYRVEKLE